MGTVPIFYDTETTGIRVDGDRIIEIAAYDPIGNRTFVELINPKTPIPAGATAVHHITDEMVATAAGFAEVGQRFIDFCGNDAILIAHNNDAFDLPFIRNECSRNQLVLPSWRYIDTLKWARRYRPDIPRHSLQFLREMYGIAANNAHRALDDVMVLHQVFKCMTDDLPMEDICALMTKPASISRMPFGKYKGQAIEKIPKDYAKWLSKEGFFEKPENQELKAAFEQLGLIKTANVG